ncbi:MAG: hypothetical protein ACRDG3_00200 [Tepidiformaceae bacterium]
MRVRVTVLGSGRTWWEEAHRQAVEGVAPADLIPLLLGNEGELVVEMDRWRELWTWAQTIDGWHENDGLEQLGSEFEEQH